jgi:hypothetical protein
MAITDDKRKKRVSIGRFRRCWTTARGLFLLFPSARQLRVMTQPPPLPPPVLDSKRGLVSILLTSSETVVVATTITIMQTDLLYVISRVFQQANQSRPADNPQISKPTKN